MNLAARGVGGGDRNGGGRLRAEVTSTAGGAGPQRRAGGKDRKST